MQDSKANSSNSQAVISQPLIGQPLNRIDGRLKVMGRATYAAEHQIPNAAYAVLITSTIAKAASFPWRHHRRSTQPACCW